MITQPKSSFYGLFGGLELSAPFPPDSLPNSVKSATGVNETKRLGKSNPKAD